jgi:hypothetical protein
LNAGRGILECDQGNKYRTDAEGGIGKANMLADDEAPLKEESDDAIQEESLWERVRKSCTLHTEIL